MRDEHCPRMVEHAPHEWVKIKRLLGDAENERVYCPGRRRDVNGDVSRFLHRGDAPPDLAYLLRESKTRRAVVHSRRASGKRAAFEALVALAESQGFRVSRGEGGALLFYEPDWAPIDAQDAS